ncbi:MAG: hypothetical protein QXU79_04420 [Candidatus Micrarchaeaceae archaeon]
MDIGRNDSSPNAILSGARAFSPCERASPPMEERARSTSSTTMPI